MYPHYTNARTAAGDFLQGVIDTPETTLRSIAESIQHPKQSLKTLKHPLRNGKKLMRKWEDNFEKNPFRATGEAVGLGLEVIGTAALARYMHQSPRLRAPKCPGGVCRLPGSNAAKTVFLSVEGATCTGCTSSIRQALAEKGIHNVHFTPIKDKSTRVIVQDAGVTPAEIKSMIEDMGFESELIELH
jgi:copper chaperone CopZ